MNEIKMTVELCAEDRARLDAILDALKNASKSTQETTKTETFATVKEEPKITAVPEICNEATPWDEVKEEPNKEEKKISLSDIQALAIKLARSGKKAEARDIVKTYGEKVTDIPADKYNEAFEKLSALEV